MSQHVSRDFIEIDKKSYNLSFIIVKNSNSIDPWTNFFRRTPWTSDVTTPRSFFTLDLGFNGRHIFHPCAPFQLLKDECSAWLEWSVVPPNERDGDEVKMLTFMADPRETLANAETKTGIAAHPNITLWAEQLLQQPPPILGTLSRMETLVRTTISSSIRNTPNIIANKLRQDLRDMAPNTKKDSRYPRSRSRSPDRRRQNRTPDRRRSPYRPRSPHQYSIQPMHQQQYVATQGPSQQPMMPPVQGTQQPAYATQQQMNPPQLNQQQLQWNNGMQNMMLNQPQPGLLYQPQRTNAPQL
jgi:hypothetical protein